MKWSDIDWKAALKTIAPTVASIFGTPLAGAGVAALLEAIFPGQNDGLSQQQAEAKLATAVSGGLSPEQYVAAQQADLAFKQHCIDAGVRLEELATADVVNARARDIALITAGRPNTRANVMLIVAAVMLVALVGVLAMAKTLGINESGPIAGVLIFAIGALMRDVESAFNFEFGSSRGGERSKTILADIVKGKS